MANNFTIRYTVQQVKQNIDLNRSYFKIRVYLKANGIGWGSKHSYNGNINVNGYNYPFSWSPGYDTFGYASRAEAEIGSTPGDSNREYEYFTHDSEGNKTVSISVSFDGRQSGNSNAPGYLSTSGSYTFSKINRKPILYVDNVYSIGINSCKFHYTVSRSTNFTHLQYSLNGGNAVQAFGNDVYIDNLSPNTTYRIKVRGVSSNWSIYGEWSSEYSFKTYDYSKLTSAPDFNDENSPNIRYSNPFGNSVSSLQACISWTGTDDIGYRDINKTNGSYTFNLSSSERNKIREAMYNKNSMGVTFYVRTISNGKTYYSAVARTITIVNANPSFGNITYKDNNSKTVGITGNNQIIVRNNSELLFTLGGATLRKNARIKEYKINIEGIERKTSTAGNINFGTLNLAYSVDAVCTVTDSRNNTNTIKKRINIENWKQPNALIKIKRKENFYSPTSINVDATYSSILNKNTIDIKFQYKKEKESTYSQLFSLEDNKEKIVDLDNSTAWNIKIILKDRLGTTTYNAYVDRGIPIIYIDRLKKSFGVGCFPKYENSIEANGVRLNDNIYLGNQVMYDHYSSSQAGTTVLLGAYYYSLIEGLFTGIEIPRGYTKGYKITAQVQTSNKNEVTVELNNIKSNSSGTWSGAEFRQLLTSRVFKQSEIVLETTHNYSTEGINLKVHNSDSYEFNIYNITIHAYLVKED